MSAADQLLKAYTLDGIAPPGAASLTGDLSQMQKAVVARILQSTSPGLTGNDAGSLGEQIQRLVDLYAKSVSSGLPSASASGSPLQRLLAVSEQLLGSTASVVAADQAGSLAAMVKFVATSGSRNPYAPNRFDSWGFHGFQPVTSLAGGGTDPAAASVSNLRWLGYEAAGGGAVSYTQANPVAGRGRCFRLESTAASGGVEAVRGVSGVTGTSNRIMIPGIPNYPSAVYGLGQIVVEAAVVPDLITDADLFVGLAAANDMFGSTYAVGAAYSSAIDGNWRALNNNNGTVSTDKTAGTVAASTASVQVVRTVVTATGVTVSVDGTTVSSAYTTNFPSVLTGLMPYVAVIPRSAAQRLLYVERLFDWVQ